jgi:hypothetical protein
LLDRDPGAGRDRSHHRDHRALGQQRSAARGDGTAAGCGRRTARGRGTTSGRRAAPGGGSASGARRTAGQLDQRSDQGQGDDGAGPVAHGDTTAMDQLPDRTRRGAELGRDLIVGVSLHGAADERLALSRGELADRGNHPRQLLVAQDDVGRARRAGEIFRKRLVRARVAARVERSVPNDCVKPGLQVHLSGRVAQRSPRAEEALLDDILGAIRGRVGGREGDQAGSVAANDLLERRLTPLARECHQAIVRLRTQHRARDRPQPRPYGP